MPRRRSSGARKVRAPISAANPEDIKQLAEELGRFLRPASKVSPPFGKLMTRWLAEHVSTLAPSNQRDIRSTLSVHLRWFQHHTSETLTPTLVRDRLTHLHKKGKLSARTVTKIRGVGAQVVDHAVAAQEWTAPNPFRFGKPSLKREKKPKQVLTPTEAWDGIHGVARQWRNLTAAAFYLGARKGELFAVRRVDVELAKGDIWIRGSHERECTKNGEQRRCPIHDELRPFIEDQLATTKSEWLFPNPKGQQWHWATKVNRMFRTGITRAGILRGYRHSCRKCGRKYEDESGEIRVCDICGWKMWAQPLPRHLTFHGIRHCAATLYRQAGCDPLVISKLLGHEKSGSNITESVYTHLTDDYCRRGIHLLKLRPRTPSADEPDPVASESKGSRKRGSHRTSNPRVGGSNPSGRASLFATPGFRTAEEVAAALRLKRETIYRWVKSGKLKAQRLGSIIRIHTDDVDALFNGGGSEGGAP